MSFSQRAFLVLALSLIASSCINRVNKYSMADPMWTDSQDMRAFSPMPEEYFSPFAWDGADNIIFRPLARVFALDPAGQAVNVNAMDEVPDSSWYTNRLSRHSLSTERIVQASCDEQPLDAIGPWTITSAKPNGANPGFIIEDAEGRAYLLKFDSPKQPERATAADVMGSIIYWAAGYHTPCNRIVFFDKEILKISKKATAEKLGKKIPLTWEMLDPVFEKAYQRKDGKWRAASSKFLPGRPIGPWRYEGMREDDPNDVIPHEDRRELRGAYALASWVNHFDSREQNTLAMWISDENNENVGHVRHNYIDFGDCFGSMWAQLGMSERLGHSSYLDVPHLAQDFITLGAIPRPWRKNKLGAAGKTLGYFNVETFEPDKYHPGYPNPAFLRAREQDNAWMARIIANLSEDTIRAIVHEANLENQTVHDELVRILIGRRKRLLDRWFRKISPLTKPRVMVGAARADLCVQDLAVSSGLLPRSERVYRTSAWEVPGKRPKRVSIGPALARGPHEVCVTLPSAKGASVESPKYWVVDILAKRRATDKEARPARIHLYQSGKTEYKVVGLQRPSSKKSPRYRD